jgi:hypothetical protein
MYYKNTLLSFLFTAVLCALLPTPLENSFAEPPIMYLPDDIVYSVPDASIIGDIVYSEVDILYLYTPEVLHLYDGNTSVLREMAITGTNQINSALDMSHVVHRVHMVGLEQSPVTDSEVADYVGLLYAVTQSPDISVLRSIYGADQVAVLTSLTTYCGIAWLLNVPVPDYAYSVVTHLCAVSYYTIAHEFGHSGGCCHQVEVSAKCTGWNMSSSFGYQDPNSRYRSVMSYQCPDGCPRLLAYSNPESIVELSDGYQGVLGSGSSNNAASLNESLFFMASYRSRVTMVPTDAPMTLSPTGSSTLNPSPLPTTQSPTDLPTTAAPTTRSPTDSPVSVSPTAFPTMSPDGFCGDGSCKNSENCLSCPEDCKGIQYGKQSKRYCCTGDGGCDGQGCLLVSCTTKLYADCFVLSRKACNTCPNCSFDSTAKICNNV